jgi:GNAT superfamily N-acetyltransferase
LDQPFIESATFADTAAVLALDKSADAAARAEWLSAAVRAEDCLVARSTDGVLGFAVAERSFFSRPFLDLLIVAERARRRGIGTALVLASEARWRPERLFTSTNASNLPMQGLLATLGYDRSGVVQNLDPGDPELIYISPEHRQSATF